MGKLWRGVRPLLLAGVALSLMAGSATAQMPSDDPKAQQSWFANSGLRLVEWYTTVKHWRKTALDAAETKITETKQVVRMREKYERMAIGELGKIGGEIPDWRDYANFCTMDDVGETVCQDQSPIEGFVGKYEDILQEEIDKFESEVFAQLNTVETEAKALIGDIAGDLGEDITNDWEDIGSGEAEQAGPQIQETAEMSTHIDSVAATVDSVIQSMLAKEVNDSTGRKKISSGRAQQLSAWIAWAEANIVLAELRSSTERARRKALEVADRQKEYLRDETFPEAALQVGY